MTVYLRSLGFYRDFLGKSFEEENTWGFWMEIVEEIERLGFIVVIVGGPIETVIKIVVDPDLQHNERYSNAINIELASRDPKHKQLLLVSACTLFIEWFYRDIGEEELIR